VRFADRDRGALDREARIGGVDGAREEVVVEAAEEQPSPTDSPTLLSTKLLTALRPGGVCSRTRKRTAGRKAPSSRRSTPRPSLRHRLRRGEARRRVFPASSAARDRARPPLVQALSRHHLKAASLASGVTPPGEPTGDCRFSESTLKNNALFASVSLWNGSFRRP